MLSYLSAEVAPWWRSLRIAWRFMMAKDTCKSQAGGSHGPALLLIFIGRCYSFPLPCCPQALQHFAHAATLSARAGPAAWQELFSSSRQLWNVCRSLINQLPAFTMPLPAVAWSQGLLPGPCVPALAAEAAPKPAADGSAADAAAAKGKTGGKAAAAGKAAAGGGDKKGAAAGGAAKGGKPGLPVVPEAVIRQLLLPEKRGPNAASTLRWAVSKMHVVCCRTHTTSQQWDARCLELICFLGLLVANRHASASVKVHMQHMHNCTC